MPFSRHIAGDCSIHPRALSHKRSGYLSVRKELKFGDTLGGNPGSEQENTKNRGKPAATAAWSAIGRMLTPFLLPTRAKKRNDRWDSSAPTCSFFL